MRLESPATGVLDQTNVKNSEIRSEPQSSVNTEKAPKNTDPDKYVFALSESAKLRNRIRTEHKLRQKLNPKALIPNMYREDDEIVETSKVIYFTSEKTPPYVPEYEDFRQLLTELQIRIDNIVYANNINLGQIIDTIV